MTIEIKNFGPIDYLAFDLEKDLHLIYGQNAIGKSYATYVIYCLLKNIRQLIHMDIENYKVIESFENIIEKTNENDITDVVSNHIENQLLEGFRLGFQKSLLNSFSSLKNLNNSFTNKSFEIKVYNNENVGFSFHLDRNENLKLKFLSGFKRVKKDKNTFYFDDFDQDKVITAYNLSTKLVLNLVSIVESLRYGIREIHYLPASRSGLYQGLNSFAPIIAELSQHRHLLKNNTIELPTLPEPLADFFKDISTVDKNHINTAFSEAVEKIEQKILQGKIDYNEETRKITFQPSNTKLELNLSQASSMVAEIAPMIIYFKHIIGSKNRQFDDNERIGISDIIFIEEPEAHLHPEVQVALLEIFAALSKLGLKIFITSHSNYMFNKLNNLIIDNQIDREKIAIYHLVRGENGSTQNMNMLVSADGIEDDNFQATSEKLYEERMRIYESAHD